MNPSDLLSFSRMTAPSQVNGATLINPYQPLSLMYICARIHLNLGDKFIAPSIDRAGVCPVCPLMTRLLWIVSITKKGIVHQSHILLYFVFSKNDARRTISMIYPKERPLFTDAISWDNGECNQCVTSACSAPSSSCLKENVPHKWEKLRCAILRAEKRRTGTVGVATSRVIF